MPYIAQSSVTHSELHSSENEAITSVILFWTALAESDLFLHIISFNSPRNKVVTAHFKGNTTLQAVVRPGLQLKSKIPVSKKNIRKAKQKSLG
jgi:16S rRNA C1402 N4-methylase RsmH